MPARNGISVGIDLVSVNRIESILGRWGDRFLDRIFTPAEVNYCRSRHSPARSLAARFAAKEAFFKAVSGMGGGNADGMHFREVEVVMGSNGAPRLRTSGGAKVALGGSTASLSLSHEEDLAVAIVITSLENKAPEVSG